LPEKLKVPTDDDVPTVTPSPEPTGPKAVELEIRTVPASTFARPVNDVFSPVSVRILVADVVFFNVPEPVITLLNV
jgi:hypothetical protein